MFWHCCSSRIINAKVSVGLDKKGPKCVMKFDQEPSVEMERGHRAPQRNPDEKCRRGRGRGKWWMCGCVCGISSLLLLCLLFFPA